MVKKRLNLRGGNSKATKAEAEIIRLFTSEFLTVKQIARRRNTSDKAVYKILARAKKKGLLSSKVPHETKVEKTRCGIQPFYKEVEQNINRVEKQTVTPSVRLHGQEFNVKILWKGPGYKDLVGKLVDIDSNSIRLYRDSLEIYGTASFIAPDEHKATADSMRYWSRFFRKLENDLNIIIVKARQQNITLVKAHYAEINNEMARDCEVNHDKVQIFAREDGKLWFIIDNSFNFWEAETLHTQTSKQDMGKVRKQLNDWRDHDPPTNSELSQALWDAIEINKETSDALLSFVRLLHDAIAGLASINKAKGGQSGQEKKRPDYII